MQKPTITTAQLRILAQPLALYNEREIVADGIKIRVMRLRRGYECSVFAPGSTEADLNSINYRCAERAITSVCRIVNVKPSKNSPQGA